MAKRRVYTDIGRRIAALAETQRPIARALGMVYQTVSRKLRGLCSISVSELETLSRAFKVPMSYFVTDGPPDPEVEAALKRVRSRGRTFRNLLDGQGARSRFPGGGTGQPERPGAARAARRFWA